ncbi:MAG: efflux RND transporter periplasmic adaptor subunit [Candidatus Paceibacterota bacterium]|jgi:HlyD family secretion protein
MKNFLNKIKTYALAHKIISSVFILLILLLGYWGYGKITSASGETRYVMGTATRGTIISSVAGSGQVSAINQIDIKPNVSGTITYVGVQPGDKVASGKLLFSIDDTTAQKAVRDAKINLQSANYSLQKLQIQNSNENINTDSTKTYADALNTISETFLDIPPTITGIENLLNNSDLSDNAARKAGATAVNYLNKANTAYYTAKAAYEKNKINFGPVNSNSKSADIEALAGETYNTTNLLADATKSLNDYVNYLAEQNNNPSGFSSYQSTLSQYTNTINADSSSLLTAQTSINSYKDSLPNNEIDMQGALISVAQKQNALTDAEQNLSDYYIRAPFDGVIASVPVQKGDDASSGTTLGTIITAKQMAVISLNEVDIAKIQLGQKVTLTFDAIPNLTIAGKVTQVDAIGTVSQGVVNYDVKITFDTNDERIKPGMTVNATIITNVQQDVLTVPNSAIKNQGGNTYVEIFNTPLPIPLSGIQGSPSATLPTLQAVVVGTSDDTSTEIISGLSEGDKIVIKTIVGAKTVATSTPSLLNAVSGNRAGAAAGGTGRTFKPAD